MLEVVHRREHLGQVLDPRLEFAERFEHTGELRKLLHRFEDKCYLSQLLLKRSDLIENRRHCQTGLKRSLLSCHADSILTFLIANSRSTNCRKNSCYCLNIYLLI